MPKLTLRDLLWLVLVVALGVGWSCVFAGCIDMHVDGTIC
jgi:hypothetical protein